MSNQPLTNLNTVLAALRALVELTPYVDPCVVTVTWVVVLVIVIALDLRIRTRSALPLAIALRTNW